MIKSEQNTFTFSLDIGIWENWTCKHKVGHCDLTLLCFFFISIILNTKIPLMFQSNFYQLYLMVPETKLILMVLLFLVTTAILEF